MSARLRPAILDRYIIAETIPPTAIGLLVFSFILLINEIPRLLAVLVARSADGWTVVRVFANIVPSILAVTIPMAFLLGVLLAFGRLASESELIAMRANGVSVSRLGVPVLILSVLSGGVTFYIHAVAVPAANQAYRELVFGLVAAKARNDVRPRNFTSELDPRMMLFVSDIDPDSGLWRNVFIHDTRDAEEPRLLLGPRGPHSRRQGREARQRRALPGRAARLRQGRPAGVSTGAISVSGLSAVVRGVLP